MGRNQCKTRVERLPGTRSRSWGGAFSTVYVSCQYRVERLAGTRSQDFNERSHLVLIGGSRTAQGQHTSVVQGQLRCVVEASKPITESIHQMSIHQINESCIQEGANLGEQSSACLRLIIGRCLIIPQPLSAICVQRPSKRRARLFQGGGSLGTREALLNIDCEKWNADVRWTGVA